MDEGCARRIPGSIPGQRAKGLKTHFFCFYGFGR